jgi:hypothetical protein
MHALCESGHFVKFVTQLVLTIVNPHCRSLLTCRFSAVYCIKNPKQRGLHSIRRNGIVKGKPERLEVRSSNGIESLRWSLEALQMCIFIRFGVCSPKAGRVRSRLGFPLTTTFRLMECRPRCFGFCAVATVKLQVSRPQVRWFAWDNQQGKQIGRHSFSAGPAGSYSVGTGRSFFYAGCRYDGIVPS